VDPVPDPLPFFSGCAGNRTRASGSDKQQTLPSKPISILLEQVSMSAWHFQLINYITISQRSGCEIFPGIDKTGPIKNAEFI
jgi:hypothetical protein